ncbi:hybrid sensor histidine kinase/response regulator [Falsiroseomonas tokyonensis]|uniref:histidine kinase n=1 Tax=Falsiroseomonas tokyonensis TaxID=430521 RepID=A0ABV7BWJ2_9PROT|nr:response regulator [Falsiroseomonas tokyonensis]
MFPPAADPDVPPGKVAKRSWPWRQFELIGPFLAILPLAAFSLAVVLGFKAERAADRAEDVVRTTTALVAGLDSELRAGLRALDALAGSQHLKSGDLSGFRQEAQRLLAREPYWFTIALTDGERQILNLRYPEGAPLPAIQDLAAVGSVLRTGYAALGGLVERRVSYRVPVRVDGVVRFALVATQEATTFAMLLDRAGLPRGWSALLLDGDGRVIARAASGRSEPELLRPALSHRDVTEVGGMTALALPLGDSRWSLLVAAPPPGFIEKATSWLVVALGLATLVAALGIAARMTRREPAQEVPRPGGQSEAMARAAEQDRSRNALMAAVSQELCAPLTGLLDYTDRLAKAELPAEARGWVEQQRQAGGALLALVGDVLDFARLEEGSIALEDTDIEIAALLEDCAALMRPAAQAKGLALQLAIDAGLPRWIRGDPMRLRQVTTKLLDNAIRASPQGSVVLAARLTPRPERVEISVLDQGPGILEAEMPRLFDRFRDSAAQQAVGVQAVRGGSGLGLAICRRVVEAMGGAIGAESPGGNGARFVFWVPFRPGAAPAQARGTQALRILVAEDVAASRLLLATLLERAGHQVTATADGPAALAALHGARFDLAVLDLHMPGLGGLGVAQAVRALQGEASRMPMIALTADSAEELEGQCRAAGFDAVLRKPFETRRLLGLVDGLRMRRVGA